MKVITNPARKWVTSTWFSNLLGQAIKLNAMEKKETSIVGIHGTPGTSYKPISPHFPTLPQLPPFPPSPIFPAAPCSISGYIIRGCAGYVPAMQLCWPLSILYLGLM